MPGILDDNYGVAEARRSRRTKRIILVVLGVLIVVVPTYLYFRTWSEEQTVKSFLAKLDSKDFQGAYAMWGCTQAKPCPNYDPGRFNQDWGPETPYSKTANAQMANVDSCDAGVVVLLRYPNADPVSLWVEKSTQILSFAPWPRCPGRHWEFKRFFQTLFSKES